MSKDRNQPAPASFSELLASARQGSTEAAGVLINAYRDYLLSLASRQFPDDLSPKAAPSDLAQETIMSAYQVFEQFQGESEGEFLAWLREILNNTVRDFVRSYRECQKRDPARERSLDDAEGRQAFVLPGGPCPVNEAEKEEFALALRWAVVELPGDAQRALHLHYLDRLSFGEIGSLLGVSAEAARQLCLRSLYKLQKQLNWLGVFAS